MRDIEYIEDLIDKVEKLFEHGHSRAKNHDQRLGQWIINKIRFNEDKELDNDSIVRYLFNIENNEFMELVEDYNN